MNPMDYFQSGLKQLYDEGLFTDITVQVDTRKFRCHKVVLASFSPYFKAMLSIDMRESKEDSINLPFLSAETFECLAQFCYTSDLSITDKIDDIFRASCFLQIECLQSRCERRLLQNLNPENCLGIWRLGNQYSSPLLIENAREYILSTFQNDSLLDVVLDLSAEELLQVIGEVNCRTTFELGTCRAGLHWLQNNQNCALDTQKKVLQALPLPLTNVEFLDSLTKEYPFLETDQAGSPDFMKNVRGHRDEFENVLLVIGGTTDRSETDSQHLMCYNLQHQTWYSLDSPPYHLQIEFAACVFDSSKIVISGGGGSDRSSAEYDGKTGKWRTYSNMHEGRSRHSSIAKGHCVYVLGGYYYDENTAETTLGSIEEYDMKTEKWKMIGILNIPVQSTCVAVSANCILVFGGATHDNCPDLTTAHVQCFNTSLHVTTTLFNLPKPERYLRSVGFGDRIFLLKSNGHVWQVEGRTGVKDVGRVNYFEIGTYATGTIKYKSGMLILGGIDINEVLEDILYYSCESNETTTWGVLPFRLSRFGCGEVALKKCFMEKEQ